ncbi:MAG: RNA 2',3'-cyclic phosphodiesterase [Deltaproteobacteria bacterium]|nr:RNA 2',3'-cyclic phosphodiesterase [Deltaproteobacteria bacterium]
MSHQPGTIRSFIAIELPGQVIEAIKKLQEDLRKYGLGIRWVRPENIHLTLKFLGNISEEDVAPITSVLKTATDTTEPFHLRGQGLGIVPGISRPQVIWIGMSGDVEPLKQFQLRVEEGLEQLGFPKEKRPFRSHLTIGRVKGKLEKRILLEAIEQLGIFESDSFIADSIILFRSDLQRSGAVYTKLAEVPLRI